VPHSSEGRSGEIQDLLLPREKNRGTRHSIMAGYEELAEIAAEKYGDEDRDVGRCASSVARRQRERSAGSARSWTP